MLKKMFATFLKMLVKKYLQQFKKLLKNKKSQSVWVFVDFESAKWAVFVLRGLYSSLAYPPSGR
jgi:hypothetical protein